MLLKEKSYLVFSEKFKLLTTLRKKIIFTDYIIRRSGLYVHFFCFC